MKSKSFSISKHLPILFLLIFLSFFAHLGNIPLFDPDEGAYSEVTREMLENQDFTVALLNDMPFFHKPPLFYWSQAASIKTMGLNELALRLPSAIAALLWAGSIFLFTRRSYDTRTAWHATLFMGASLLVTLMGRAATPEALFNLFLSLTLFNIYRFYQTGSKRHIYWSFMFAALGVLTKGGIAIMLPAVVSIIFFGGKRKWQELLLLFFNPVGLMVFGLIVIPWYLGEFILHGEAFLSDLLMLPGMSVAGLHLLGYSIPYYAYPLLLFIGLLPFSAMFLKAIFQIRKLLPDELIQYLLLWTLLAVLLLPLIQPRSLFSIACCFPPLFIIMARVIDVFRHSIALFIWPLLVILLLFLLPYMAPYISTLIQDASLIGAVTAGVTYFDAFYRLSLGALVLLLAILPFIRTIPSTVKYGILGLLFVSMTNFLILPIMGNILQQPVKSAAVLAKKENLDVIMWKANHPSFNVYAEMLTGVGTPQEGDTVFTKLASWERNPAFEILYEKNGVSLVKILATPANDSVPTQTD